VAPWRGALLSCRMGGLTVCLAVGWQAFVENMEEDLQSDDLDQIIRFGAKVRCAWHAWLRLCAGPPHTTPRWGSQDVFNTSLDSVLPLEDEKIDELLDRCVLDRCA